VWNFALALQKERLEKKERCQSYYQMAPLLLEWKGQEKTNFLNECPSQTLQQTLMFLDRAIKDAFDQKSAKRFPRFKKRGRDDSFRYPQGIKVKDDQLFLPRVHQEQKKNIQTSH
jgi:putative transposase